MENMLGNSTIVHVQKVKKFTWSDLRYLLFTKCKTLTGEPYDISCPRNGKV